MCDGVDLLEAAARDRWADLLREAQDTPPSTFARNRLAAAHQLGHIRTLATGADRPEVFQTILERVRTEH